MKLYEVFIRGSKGNQWVVANNNVEAMEILALLSGVDLNDVPTYFSDFSIERISAINPIEGGYIKCDELTKNWNTGYFDWTQGKTFEYRKNMHWYPFVEYSIRAHYIDIALGGL